MGKKKFDLVKIIYNDLYMYGKLQLFLLTAILITAVLIVFINHKTRCMIMIREKIFLEKNILEDEWRHFLIEEKILSRFDRIENISIDKLKMHYVDESMNFVLLN